VVGYKRKIALFSNMVGLHSSVPFGVSHLETGKDQGKDLGKDELSKGKVRVGQRRSRILGVVSYGQPAALIPPEASPHRR
jgi:hypothetical protein